MKVVIISLLLIAVSLVIPSVLSQDQLDEDATFDQLSESLLNSADFEADTESHNAFGGSSKSISSSLFTMLFDYAVAQLKAKLALVTVAAASKGGKVVLNVKNTNAIMASWSSDINLNATSATLLTSAANSIISMNVQNNSTVYTGVIYSSLQTFAANSKVRSVAIKSADSVLVNNCSAFLTTVSSNLTANVVDSKVGIANVTSTVDVTANKRSTIKWWTKIPGYGSSSKVDDSSSSEQVDDSDERDPDDYYDDKKENFGVSVFKHIKNLVLQKEKVMH